jgi:CubicO group peptidase (beta-lactamase class C family)
MDIVDTSEPGPDLANGSPGSNRLRVWVRRTIGALLAGTMVVAGGAFWMRDEIARLWAVNTLFEPDRIVANFSRMDHAFHSVALPPTDAASPLPLGPGIELGEEVEAWIAERSVTGLVVLRDGRIVHESYHLGTEPHDRRISWSVAKSFLSLLAGVIVAEGAVSPDDPVTKHAPALAGSAYDGVTLRDVLAMCSGVAFDEDYLDPGSDINRMGRVLALGGSMDEFAAGLRERTRPPGKLMEYVSIDTHVIGMVLRGATGRDIPELMAEKITGPMGISSGLEAAYYLTDGEGTAFVLGGLNMTTRDYARLGLLVAEDGRVGARQVVPPNWIDESTTPRAPTLPGAPRYGYQWWLPADARPGEVVARGIYGQHVYVDRTRGVVVAMNAADRGFRDPGVWEGNIEMFRAIADRAAR